MKRGVSGLLLLVSTLSALGMNADGAEQMQGDRAHGELTGLVSPLVLDFSGRRIVATKSVSKSGVHFDVDGDGIAEQTGWVEGATVAFLALDLNKNGIIDDGGELFGTATKVEDLGNTAENGFLALAQYDRNSDGRIDSQDEIYSRLLLWFDENQNGHTDKGEVVSVAEHGVSVISVRFSEVDHKVALQHKSDLVPNDVRFRSYFWGSQCPRTGCSSYDVFFGTLDHMVVVR